MKQVNKVVLSAPTSASKNGDQLDANNLINASFHAVFTGTDEAGSIKVQASNDVAPLQITGVGFTVANWIDIPNASTTITSGGPAIITIVNMPYRWIRAVWTRTGGGAANKNVSVSMFAQSV